jgi:hypothetical protein
MQKETQKTRAKDAGVIRERRLRIRRKVAVPESGFEWRKSVQ